MAKTRRNKQKLVVILGPTSSGKSDLAVDIARRFRGEVISADSRQVYRGMNLGTGKITPKEMRSVKHYMLDVANPKSGNFNAAKFQSKTNVLIKKISKNGNLPILAGGTGFWIDAVARSQNLPEVPPNRKLRKNLSGKSTAQLFAILQKADPKRATGIKKKNETNNRHRLIRAIEIAKAKIKPSKKELPEYEALFIGLDLPTEKLYARIEKRLENRIKKGMIKEVRHLHERGVSWKRLENFGLEYKFIAQHLQKKLTLEQMKELLAYAIKHYAKRQRTWFKRYKDIIWFNPENKTSAKQISRLITKFIEK